MYSAIIRNARTKGRGVQRKGSSAKEIWGTAYSLARFSHKYGTGGPENNTVTFHLHNGNEFVGPRIWLRNGELDWA